MRVTDIFSFIFLNGNKIIYLFYNSVSSTISQWEAFNNEQTAETITERIHKLQPTCEQTN